MGRPRTYSDVEPLGRKEAVKGWLGGLAEGDSRTGALYTAARYLRWRTKHGLNADPDRMIEECLHGNAGVVAEHARALLRYCEDPEVVAMRKRATVMKAYKTIRGFYQANLVSLPGVRPKVNDPPGVVEVKVTATEFLGYVKAVLAKGKLSARDRSITLVMLQTGMDASTLAKVFNYVAYPQLAKTFGGTDPSKWDESRCPVRIELHRPKSSYRYYSYLDVDGLRALKDWLESRELKLGAGLAVRRSQPGHMDTSDPIYVRYDGKPLLSTAVTRIFYAAGGRAGVNRPPSGEQVVPTGAAFRYPYHSHECRDTMITLARRVGADIAAVRFFTGHNIDPQNYDKSPWDSEESFRKQYMLVARPHLNPISGEMIAAKAEAESGLEDRDRWMLSEIESLRRQMDAILSGRGRASGGYSVSSRRDRSSSSSSSSLSRIR